MGTNPVLYLLYCTTLTLRVWKRLEIWLLNPVSIFYPFKSALCGKIVYKRQNFRPDMTNLLLETG